MDTGSPAPPVMSESEGQGRSARHSPAPLSVAVIVPLPKRVVWGLYSGDPCLLPDLLGTLGGAEGLAPYYLLGGRQAGLG